MDEESPVAALTAQHEMQAYLKRRLETLTNPLVCKFGDNQGPAIMTLSKALAERTRVSNKPTWLFKDGSC
jgi:hypothetical protein